jgi:HPt (histidine-containing phosphotransfer) domain-containing protein
MEPILDTATALERVEGDVELLRELAEMFLEHAPVMMAEVRDAWARRDAAALQRAAHALKGSAANLAAVAVCDAAKHLELLGRGGDLGAGDVLMADLELEMARLEAALRQAA